jgi:hypothetical protein
LGISPAVSGATVGVVSTSLVGPAYALALAAKAASASVVAVQRLVTMWVEQFWWAMTSDGARGLWHHLPERPPVSTFAREFDGRQSSSSVELPTWQFYQGWRNRVDAPAVRGCS